MVVAVIVRAPSKSSADFTKFITRILEYTNIQRAAFAGDFYVNALNHISMARNYADVFH